MATTTTVLRGNVTTIEEAVARVRAALLEERVARVLARIGEAVAARVLIPVEVPRLATAEEVA